MRCGVFLLILLDCCSVFRCNLRQFFAIDKQKNWQKAQEYCRRKHSDLATIYDMKDLQEIKNVNGTGWIGLQTNPGKENRQWRWSLPGVKGTPENWEKNQIFNHRGDEDCVFMDNEGLQDDLCNTLFPFCCYNESPISFQFLEEKCYWTDAQHYCRQHHTDLVSGNEQLEQAKANCTERVWIGLFRDNWNWSDGSNSSFRNWEVSSPSENQSCAVLQLHGKWQSKNCDDKNQFICYKDKFIVINKNMTWEESLVYCRQHHDDLVSITNLADQKWVQMKVENATSSHVWLGLRYTCTLQFWFWVSDEVVIYDNWKKNEKPDVCDMSGAMETGGQHKWIKHSDTERFNFICSKS